MLCANLVQFLQRLADISAERKVGAFQEQLQLFY